MNTINFFWSGSNWTFLHGLCIRTHLKVGHKVVIWVHNSIPKNRHWISDGIDIKNANDIIDINTFLKNGGNFKTASSLWRFNFLYEYGGWYSDTDALAINEWHNDNWVICSGEDENKLSTGIIKVPHRQNMFLDMARDIEYDWGNVDIFNKHYFRYKRNTKPTHNNWNYYPYNWKQWDTILNDAPIIQSKSIHLYHTMFEKHELIDTIEEFIANNPRSMLSLINRWAR